MTLALSALLSGEAPHEHSSDDGNRQAGRIAGSTVEVDGVDAPSVSLAKFIEASTAEADFWDDRRRSFETLRSRKGHHLVDPSWARTFRENFTRESAVAVDRATKVIAHADKVPPPTVMTWGDLSTVIDRLGEAVQEIGMVMRGAYEVLEVFATDHWTTVFRKPLFDPYPFHWPWGYPDF